MLEFIISFISISVNSLLYLLLGNIAYHLEEAVWLFLVCYEDTWMC